MIKQIAVVLTFIWARQGLCELIFQILGSEPLLTTSRICHLRPKGLTGGAVDEREELVDWGFLMRASMAFHFDPGGFDLIGQGEKFLIECGVVEQRPGFRAILLFFQPFPSVGQADNILGVGIKGNGLGLGFAEGPEEGFDFQLRGAGVLKAFKLNAGDVGV